MNELPNYYACSFCGAKATQWFAVKHGGRFYKLWIRCDAHKRSERHNPLIDGEFLSEKEIVVLSIMEEPPKLA